MGGIAGRVPVAMTINRARTLRLSEAMVWRSIETGVFAHDTDAKTFEPRLAVDRGDGLDDAANVGAHARPIGAWWCGVDTERVPFTNCLRSFCRRDQRF